MTVLKHSNTTAMQTRLVSLTSVPLFFSITAKEQYFIPGEWLVNVHTYHCLPLFFNYPPTSM